MTSPMTMAPPQREPWRGWHPKAYLAEFFGTALQNCMVRGIANPPKCVNSRSILRNGDRDIMLLWTNGGDPWTGKR